MTDECCEGNLANLTHGFITQVALSTLSGAITVLKTCEDLLSVTQQINIVNQCIEVISAKACDEADFPSCLPPNCWAEELAKVQINFFQKIIESMKSRGAKALTIACAITTYVKRSLPDIVFDRSASTIKSPISDDSLTSKHKQRQILDSIVAILPDETRQPVFSINFLCHLLRIAVLLENTGDCKRKIEKQIMAILEHVTVDDLLILSLRFENERLRDLECVRRIVTGFVEKEKSKSVICYVDFDQTPSPAMARVAKTVDAYLREIARECELSVSQFNGIANLVPKSVREVDDCLYSAIDIYLQVNADVRLAKENEKLKNELKRMKMYVIDMEKNHKTGYKTKKPTFFSSVSKTLGKLNPFKQGSKDTTNIDDQIERTKPKRRRFSMS
ncbi:hypothetical protein E3N88_35637 [Mikania micrantha]|uniref:NPH3 domain-containing protein n=1 Tax=Mikania micrantha TaxID=192012 RepID=A0A5N6M1K9_9ASTR|nr:hypothetical protein E3N88_35637 [Mikania micrantha]